MDQISPIVITSGKAQEHLNNVRVQHADIVQGIQDQSVRVANFNAQRDMEKDQKSIQNATTAKETADAENKRRELDIKEQALSL